MGPKNNSQTMTKKTKRSDDASSDSTDDADFFSSVVRHSGRQSCSQIISFAQHTNNEPTMVVRSLSIFKCATSAVRTLLSSSCDASEPSYTKQSFMTNRLGPLQHPSSSKQKKQHTLVFLVSLCGPLLCFLSTRYVFVSPGCPLVCSFNVLRAVVLWCFWCAFLYSIFVVALVSSSCKEQLALQLRSALTRSCAFELNGLNRFFSFIFAGRVFVLFARFRPSTVNFRNC